jgi:hypothetical protein
MCNILYTHTRMLNVAVPCTARCQLLRINEYLLNEVFVIARAVHCGFICHDEGLLASCKPH